MADYFWLIPLFPAAGFALVGLLGLYSNWALRHKLNKRFVHWVAVGVIAVSFFLSCGAVIDLYAARHQESLEKVLFVWIPAGNLPAAGGLARVQAEWGYLLDPLSAVMILVVTGVGLLIHIYSTGYMWEDDGYYRFFAYMNLFMFMMLTLVLANNYLFMFMGWEGVGLCSYLLIGYYFDRKSAGDAGKKAFVVNRVGDAGFLVGLMLLFVTFGSFQYRDVFSAVAGFAPETAALGVLSLICIGLFIGATGKSAQIPLYTWLPDAMEGPTPVSALIHAATMVTAGVYMVVRSSPLFGRAPKVMFVVAVVGAVTALFAATIALVQRDIKRILAYSTVSQLGYMFAAAGLGAFVAAIFHLMTHAFFKALLFLGAGSVYHSTHELDVMKMGGLKKHMPTTYWTMLVATLAISGAPLLSGFFSKDEILWQAWNVHKGIWLVAWVAAGLTAFYMFRLLFLTFHGKERFDTHHPPHESPKKMTVPLVILAILAVIGGYVGLPAMIGHLIGVPNHFEHFLQPAVQAPEGVEHAIGESAFQEWIVTVLSILMAAAGFSVAYLFYLKRQELADRAAKAAQWAHTLLYRKYYVDELYDALFVNRAKDLGNGFWAFDRKVVDGLGVDGSGRLTLWSATLSGLFDLRVVDGIVNLVGRTTDAGSRAMRRLQTGLVQRYALVMIVGVFAFLSLYLWLFRAAP
ncbi:MAG: NADH-quinone oxidoreductase subunit L [Acidobacteria bacterium]|nr:NADH-quinone oxidoreductase subunit L [Acidobacteriota bacterium]